jgi:ribonucleoside-diphosphate reductase alpha subunit
MSTAETDAAETDAAETGAAETGAAETVAGVAGTDAGVAETDAGAGAAEPGVAEFHVAELTDLVALGNAFLRAVSKPTARKPQPNRETQLTAYVLNRSQKRVPVRFDLITERNEDLRSNLDYGPELAAVDCLSITADVVRRFRNGMTTRELDAETAAVCIQRATNHGDNEWLAARIYISDLHKRTPPSLQAMTAAIRGAARAGALRLSEEYQAIVARASAAIDKRLDARRDYRFRFFGYQTIARSYLLRASPRDSESSLLDTQLMERPQHMYMRIALGIFVCQPDGRGHEAPEEEFERRLEAAFTFYDALSLQLVSNATPTMLNAATRVAQMSSCFQLAAGDDLATMFDTAKTSGLCSKWGGGVSVWLHSVRARGSLILSTGGRSDGLQRYIKILNDIQVYANQGGNRPGAFAVYLATEHADIFDFLRLPRLKGEEALKAINAPDLKYALWVSDAFMEALEAELDDAERVASGGAADPSAGEWYLFSPDEAPGLHLVYGDEFRALRAKYIAEGRYRLRTTTKEIILEAFKTWSQVGNPYVMFKDHVNRKSNMMNVAPICSSNLCTEIIIPSWTDFDAPLFETFRRGAAPRPPSEVLGEFGVCNLATLILEHYLKAGASSGEQTVDHAALMSAAALEVNALNRVIDLNSTASAECRRSNQRHRPVGVGVMGLADVLARLKLCYGEPRAQGVARAIAAAVYYGALSESARIAETDGPYETFAGSPVSQGRLQPDLWVETGHLAADWETEIETLTNGVLKPAHWAALRAQCMRGVRNAYVTAYPPTATTSNIVRQNESFEPFTSGMYTRRTQAGEFVIPNPHLIRELEELGVWDEQMRRALLSADGSVQGIDRVPADVKRRFRTARELHPSLTILMAKAMAPFVCQSMSMNLFLSEPDLPKILRFLVEGWRAGLKTGMYYCHTSPATGAQKTSVSGAAQVARGGAAQVARGGAAQVALGALGAPGLNTSNEHMASVARVARATAMCSADASCASCVL